MNACDNDPETWQKYFPNLQRQQNCILFNPNLFWPYFNFLESSNSMIFEFILKNEKVEALEATWFKS